MGPFLTFWGPNGIFLGLGKGPNTVLGSTHVVEQLSFSMFSSILTFDFYLTLGSFFTFLEWFWLDAVQHADCTSRIVHDEEN